MKLWGASVWYWAAGVVTLLIVSNLFSYNIGYLLGKQDGKAKVELTQATEQKKTDDKVRIDFERVDYETPYTGSRDDRFEWLLDNARRGIHPGP